MPTSKSKIFEFTFRGGSKALVIFDKPVTLDRAYDQIAENHISFSMLDASKEAEKLKSISENTSN